MRNRRLKSIALFSGSFFSLLFLFFSASLDAVAGRVVPPAHETSTGTASIYERLRCYDKTSSANRFSHQHSRMNGKAGHFDTFHNETDLFAGANKAGAPAASQALASD